MFEQVHKRGIQIDSSTKYANTLRLEQQSAEGPFLLVEWRLILCVIQPTIMLETDTVGAKYKTPPLFEELQVSVNKMN